MGIILAMLRELTRQHLLRTLDVLAHAGFLVAPNKTDTVEDVSTTKDYLGFSIDSVKMRIHVFAE